MASQASIATEPFACRTLSFSLSRGNSCHKPLVGISVVVVAQYTLRHHPYRRATTTPSESLQHAWHIDLLGIKIYTVPAIPKVTNKPLRGQ